MTRFTYTAEKAGGDTYTGVAEAPDRFELYSIVRREGGRIVSVSEEGANNWFSIAYWNSKLTTVKEYDMILFARNLGAMLSAGLALARGLGVMGRRAKNPKLSYVVRQIARDVRGGGPFPEGLPQ